mmetsp:Transcript_133026/g.331971  ORF Transcript_133026/g.331971 Transcript_133026/m.331971 type:complete len:204 (+) Transcript_133026:1067-1678(+)
MKECTRTSPGGAVGLPLGVRSVGTISSQDIVEEPMEVIDAVCQVPLPPPKPGQAVEAVEGCNGKSSLYFASGDHSWRLSPSFCISGNSGNSKGGGRSRPSIATGAWTGNSAKVVALATFLRALLRSTRWALRRARASKNARCTRFRTSLSEGKSCCASSHASACNLSAASLLARLVALLCSTLATSSKSPTAEPAADDPSAFS